MLSNLCQKVLDEFASLNTKYGPSMSTRSNLKSFVFEGQKFPGMSNDINLEGNDRSTSVWPSGLEKEKGRPPKPVKEIENNKSTWPIVRCGRPKGSRNKKIKLASQDKDSEVMLADIVLCPTHLRRVATCVVGEENTAGSAKYGDEDDKNCVKPKGYKNKVGETANNFDKGGKSVAGQRVLIERKRSLLTILIH